MVRGNAGQKSALGAVFLDGARLLGEGLRGPELEVAFRARFDGDVEACLEELNGMVASSLRRLGLADWPGGRLGPDYMGFARLSDGDAVERLAMELLADGGSVEGLGWLGGRLFRGERLMCYLQAAEEDEQKSLAILTTNVRREIQKLRAAADPVGDALFANVKAAGGIAAPTGGLVLEELVLSRATARLPEDLSAEAHSQSMGDKGSLAVFTEVARRNERRPEGTRNSPMRGIQFEEPLVEHFMAWGLSNPADPDCEAVQLSELSNLLREGLPSIESLREASMATDEDGRALVEAIAAASKDLEEDGPGVLIGLFRAWKTALDQAGGLSEKRRVKLASILKEVERCFMEHLADPPEDWRQAVRLTLGIKPQTFSDDWKALCELCGVMG